MQSPKRTKYRKQHKGRIHGVAQAGTTLNFGAYGLKATQPERLTARQIEAARRAITCAVRAVSGSVCSQMCLCHPSPRKSVWVVVKVRPNSGPSGSSLVA